MLTKKTVNYRIATSGTKRCGTCVMYHNKSNTCSLVSGLIFVKYVCDKWQKRGPKNVAR